jgi:hypothetical protein
LGGSEEILRVLSESLFLSLSVFEGQSTASVFCPLTLESYSTPFVREVESDKYLVIDISEVLVIDQKGSIFFLQVELLVFRKLVWSKIPK